MSGALIAPQHTQSRPRSTLRRAHENPADTHLSMVFDPQIRGHTDQVFL